MDLHQGATRVAPGSGVRMEGTHGLLGRRPGARPRTWTGISPALLRRGLPLTAEQVAAQ